MARKKKHHKKHLSHDGHTAYGHAQHGHHTGPLHRGHGGVQSFAEKDSFMHSSHHEANKEHGMEHGYAPYSQGYANEKCSHYEGTEDSENATHD